MSNKKLHVRAIPSILIALVLALVMVRALPAFADETSTVDEPQEQTLSANPEEQDAQEGGEQSADVPADSATTPAPAEDVSEDEPVADDASPDDALPTEEDVAEAAAADEAPAMAPLAVSPASAASTEWSISWVSDVEGREVDWEQALVSDGTRTMTARVTWSPKNLADGETLEPGDVQIRIPWQFFTDRLGRPIRTGSITQDSRVGVARTRSETGYYTTVDEALANPASDSRGFNWIVEQDADGNYTDIVIFNIDELTNENGVFTCDINYSYIASQLTDSHKYELPASVTVDGTDVPATGNDTISATFDTSVTVPNSARKQPVTGAAYREGSESGRTEVYQETEWVDAWGEKPADADNYVFVPWLVSQEVTRHLNPSALRLRTPPPMAESSRTATSAPPITILRVTPMHGSLQGASPVPIAMGTLRSLPSTP